VLEADAFDVPAGHGQEISRRLADLLWPAAFDERTVLSGIRYDFESEAQRTALPGVHRAITTRSSSVPCTPSGPRHRTSSVLALTPGPST
jgi:hypothetical protein